MLESSETLLSEAASSLQSAVTELSGCREIVARTVGTAQARAVAAGNEGSAVALAAVGIALGELALEYDCPQHDRATTRPRRPRIGAPG